MWFPCRLRTWHVFSTHLESIRDSEAPLSNSARMVTGFGLPSLALKRANASGLKPEILFSMAQSLTFGSVLLVLDMFS